MSINAMRHALEALEEWEKPMSKGALEAHRILRTAIEQAEKQEPYAYTYMGIKADGSQHGPHLCWRPEYMDAMSANKGAVAIPLYTTPPAAQRQWVGLTDKEILSDDTLRYYYGMNGGAGPVSQKGKKVVAATDAKLREKIT